SAGDHGSRGAAPIAVSAPDRKPRAGATSVNGRPRSTYAPTRPRSAAGFDGAWLAVPDPAVNGRCGYEIASATAAATAVLMKLSMSLFRIPGPSTVAPRTLSTSVPAVAPTTTARIAEV